MLSYRPLVFARIRSIAQPCFYSSKSSPSAFCPYKTLNVTKTSDLLTIKKAYYAKVFTLHPDRLASLPGGAPKPGTALHKQKTLEFMQTVKSYEILSDVDRRREYDLDLARGDTGRYAREAAGKPSKEGGSRPNYNWDPRQRNPYGKTDGEYGAGPGAAYETYYYGPMNQGPIYMANWKVAMLVVTLAGVLGSGIFVFAQQRMEYYKNEQDKQDHIIAEYYARKKLEAKERGFSSSIERVRKMDKSNDVE
ncbi:UNVERIFIED_CONTAM: hypothetical protein HDU68_011128 [Siphonaria sp. JEL0065]|nr:hypothetical protein HDU68_011128 [Siphonaria sp. JEL0065]